MKLFVRLIIRFYAFLMRLFPRQFREEFGEEMTVVFVVALQDVRQRGIRSVAAVWLREVRDLPLSLAREHWRAFEDRESLMTAGYKKPGWSFYPRWVLATALSIPVAVGITLVTVAVLIRLVGETVQIGDQAGPTEDVLLNYIFFPALGLSAGCLQWLLLRRTLPRINGWILATCLGWVLAAIAAFQILFFSFHYTYDPVWFTALMFVVAGLSIGFLQWLVLRRRLSHAGWWIPANITGWSLAMLAVEGLSPSTTGPAEILAYALLPAFVTSIALWLLLDHMNGGSGEAISYGEPR
jgi:hypothetical protein